MILASSKFVPNLNPYKHTYTRGQEMGSTYYGGAKPNHSQLHYQ